MTPSASRKASERRLVKVGEGAHKFILAKIREEHDRFRKFHLGYTVEQESLWKRYNRCCHPGRKIAIKPIPMLMATGKPTIRIRTPLSDPVARAIVEASQ